MAANDEVIEEDSAIVLYRQISYALFRQEFELNKFESAVGGNFALMSDDMAGNFVDVSLHILFHWCSLYEAPKTEKGKQVEEVLSALAEMTEHLCGREHK